MKNDTLISFIKAQCSSFTGNGCIGFTIKRELDEKGRVELKNKMFNNSGKCLVIEKKEACKYFKKSVLPLAELQGIYSKILLEYTNIDESIVKNIHTRFCECGEELTPRERFCERCKKIRRRETKREYQKNYRVHEVQLT
jgi:hypothetical protein